MVSKSPAVRAAFGRNSAFLVVPQVPYQGVIRSVKKQFFIALTPSIRDSPSPVAPQTDSEKRSFQFYQSRTLELATEFFDSEFWGERILQLYNEEPAIKHGLLALSSMHENYERSAEDDDGSLYNSALSHYIKAISHSNTLLSKKDQSWTHLERILISCFLFICYENLTGNHRVAVMHLKNGQKILENNPLMKVENRIGLGYTQQSHNMVVIMANFSLVDFQAMAFSDENTPYDYQTSSSIIPSIEKYFKSMTTARVYMMDIMRSLLQLIDIYHRQDLDPVSFQAHHTYLGLAISDWLPAFQRLEKEMMEKDHKKVRTSMAIKMLKVHHVCARIMYDCCFGASEMAWDAHIEQFREIVDIISTTPPFDRDTYPSSTTDAAVPPTQTNLTPVPRIHPTKILWVVATRCREPTLRRRALSMMLLDHRRELAWDSLVAAKFAEVIIKEEEGLQGDLNLQVVESDITAPWEICEARRVKHVLRKMMKKEGKAEAVLCLGDNIRKGPITVYI